MATIKVCDKCKKHGGDEIQNVEINKFPIASYISRQGNENLFSKDLCPTCRCNFYNHIRSFGKNI